MHTIIRDAGTSKADFVFYADRLLRLVGGWVCVLRVGGLGQGGESKESGEKVPPPPFSIK